MWLVVVKNGQHRVTGSMKRSVRKNHVVGNVIWKFLYKLQVSPEKVVAVQIRVGHDGNGARVK
jgi:hypothetical protein